MGPTLTKLPSKVDLSKWIVNQPLHQQPEAGPSHSISSFEDMEIQELEGNEPSSASRGPKRKRDADKGEQNGRESEKRHGEMPKRKQSMPLRTGKFHNPKCERCERSGKSCERQKTGVARACYQCAVIKVRCELKDGESGGKPKNTLIRSTLVEKRAPAPALGVPERPSSPEPAIIVSRVPSKSTQTRFVCDKQYFHENGDLAFVVEDILFKIHRFQLERCSSSVAENLLLLGGRRPVKAENGAFILQDKVDEFRALCWALYAPPHETALQYNASNFKLKLILNLFLISHKYNLESLQIFATQLLVHHCTPPKTTCRTPELEDILRLAVRNNALPLTKVVEQSLLRRLEDDQTISAAQLITLAEELGMREFQGKLYYHELVREESSFITKIPSSTAYNFPCTHLTEKQSLALFRGYRSLLHYWQHLPGAVREKKLSQLTSCKDHKKCQGEWDSAWSVEALNTRDPFPPNFDILAALERAFVAPAPIVFGAPNTQPWMRLCGRKELGELIGQLKDTLADHFLGS